ncbi:MAG: tail fiber protein [Bacteroidota bacterium]|nr:tail fiber protein [Bacteroidota bacterium]
MEGVMAVVTMVAYDFAPKNWAYCNGQLLPIAQNQALFSLLGTTFGGNGVNTFALPDFRGRIAPGTGQGNGLSNYTLGEVTGTENVILMPSNLPPHVHNGTISIVPKGGNSADENAPTGMYPGQVANGYATAPTTDTAMQGPNVISTTIGVAGASQPFSILTPYLTVNFVICMYGIFPSRN